MPAGAALVAVGGYGRGELFPLFRRRRAGAAAGRRSLDAARGDASRRADRRAERRGRALHHACWDIGLEIGSSVRTVDECVDQARRDVTVQTAMLESRFLCGSRRVFTAFRQATDAVMDPKAFLRAKMLEMRQRHVKYEDTPYSLEPNCKESPGGLRDLQVVIWVARAAGLGRNWTELAAKGLITPFEVEPAAQARRHAEADPRAAAPDRRAARGPAGVRPADRRGRELRLQGHPAQRSSEVLMHRYYWAAKAVTQLNQILMLNIEERINGSEEAPMRPIDEHFLDRGGMLEVAHDDLYAEHPHAILRTFLVYQQTPGIKGLSARTLRALYNARNLMDAGFRRDPVNRAVFMQILREPERHHARAAAAEPDLGAGPLPVGLPPHRRAHAARPVPRLHGRPAHPDGGAQRAPLLHPRACARVPVLLAAGQPVGRALAAVRGRAVPRRGQGPRRRPFASSAPPRRGASAATTASSREDSALIEFLVRQHLTMSRIAQKEDLSDADVIQSFARLVGTPSAPDGAVPADGGRHPRHQPEGVERLEGQAAGGPVPPDAARAGRRQARTWTPRSNRASRRRASCWPALGAARHRRAAVEDAGRQLLRAPRRRRHRLARALAVAPPGHRTSRWCARGRRRSATACRCWSTRPTARTCSRASAATSTAPASASRTPRSTPPAPAMRWTPSRSSARASSPATRRPTAT